MPESKNDIAKNKSLVVVQNPQSQTISRLLPNKLSTRLILLFTLLLASAMAAFTIHGIFEQSSHLENNMKQQARGLAQNLAAISADYLLTRDYTSIELSLIRASRFPGITQIQVCDANGKLLGDIFRNDDNEPQARYGQAALTTPAVLDEQIEFIENQMTIWQPVVLGDLLGWIKIQYSLDTIQQELHDIWGKNSIVGVIVIFVTGVLLAFFLRSTIIGIREYTEFAGRLNQDMGKQTRIHSSSIELVTLGASLNEVSIQLKQQSDEITKAMKELERMAASVEFAPNIVLSLNQDCEVKYINPYGKEILNSGTNDNHDILTILPGNLRALIHKVIGNHEVIAEIAVECFERHFLWTLAPVPGQPIVHAYGVDVTKRREAEHNARMALIEKYSAEEANLAKSQFLANMSHELRTPLNAIIGYSEIIKEDSEVAGHLQIIPDVNKVHGAAHHLLALINEILDLSKIEAGRMEVYFEEFNLSELVKEVIETTRPLAKKNYNQLAVEIGETPIQIYSDLIKIKQILYNLISNAAKFTSHGFIEVKMREQLEGEERWVIFDVKDSGIGMTNGQIHNVFEPFSQADNSTTRKYGGTGLGLAITKRYCEMLGGDIHVYSKPGQGSIFSIHIPLQPSQTGNK